VLNVSLYLGTLKWNEWGLGTHHNNNVLR
jgi:hypothetical protein